MHFYTLFVLCDYVNQAASYWSSIHHHPNCFRDGGYGPWPPSCYAMYCNEGVCVCVCVSARAHVCV